MKHLVSNLLKIISVLVLVIIVIFTAVIINSKKLEQARRIAEWKSVYEELIYSFNLVKMHENTIIRDEIETGAVLSDNDLYDGIKPYFNLISDKIILLPHYKYRKMNGKRVSHSERFYFDKFVITKKGMLLSVKKNPSGAAGNFEPPYYMFADINGVKKPNTIGRDIFFLNIYSDRVTALGCGADNINLKTDCSPIGSGIYCSFYYLLGGRF